jgi:hypothetical protein
VNYYLNRFALREQLIKAEPSQNLGLIVVIPCCNETALNTTLKSLFLCDKPFCDVEVIVVMNASEIADQSIINQNKQTLLDAEKWQSANFGEIASSLAMTLHFIEENSLPKKHAGVGLARKIGMDEAVRRFDVIQKDGIIVCFDADSHCETNYLVSIEKHFQQHPKTPACSIHFEHPINGNEFLPEIYNGILQYELHLRYYKNGLAYAGLPYAFHTIGSSMAVRSSIYQKQNGMNQRKAGEDFYFLQKLIPLGNFSELKTTKVIPSPRVSDRVPFGTGRAMQEWLNDEKQELLSYHPNSFIDLKKFTELLPHYFTMQNVELPDSIQAFLQTIAFEENILNIKKNSTSLTHFVKLFYNWFNAFKVLKYMHFARDNYYKDVLISEGANTLLNLLGSDQKLTLEGLLVKYRELDLDGTYSSTKYN